MNKTQFLIPILLLSVLAQQATSLSLTKHEQSSVCMSQSVAAVSGSTLNFTIIQQWDEDLQAQICKGKLNVSDYIAVQGWKPYQTPIEFFTKVGGKGKQVLEKLSLKKDVVKGQDAPDFELSTEDLQLAYGSPSQAKLYHIPAGKLLTVLKFQITDQTKKSNLGSWSIIIDLVEHYQLQQLNPFGLSMAVYDADLTASEVSSALNITPASIANSVIWFNWTPPKGIVQPVEYRIFVQDISGAILAGPINGGQPGIIRVITKTDRQDSC